MDTNKNQGNIIAQIVCRIHKNINENIKYELRSFTIVAFTPIICISYAIFMCYFFGSIVPHIICVSGITVLCIDTLISEDFDEKIRSLFYVVMLYFCISFPASLCYKAITDGAQLLGRSADTLRYLSSLKIK